MSTIPGRRANPPVVGLDTPIGPDVDLGKQDVRLPDGKRLTPARARAIVRDTRRAAGRPSLTGGRTRSPQLSMKVSDQLMGAIRAHATASGKTMSQIAREVLEQAFKASPPPGSGSRRSSRKARSRNKTNA